MSELEGNVHPFPPIDTTRNQFVVAVGRKGSGKSHAGMTLFRAWPKVDRLVIDPSGDADPGDDLQPEPIRAPIPTSWPAAVRAGALLEHHQHPDERRRRPPFRTLRYIPDLKSPTYRDDLDRVVGLALFPKDRPVLLLVDEGGEVFPVGQTGPNARVLLQQSRHFLASAIVCMPRPKMVDPLVIAQADRVLIFDLPNPDDVKRVADLIGWNPSRLAAEVAENRRRGPHWSLMYVAAEHALYRVPPDVYE